MSIVVVQATPVAIGAASGAGGVTCTFGSPVTAGNAVIAMLQGWPDSGTTWSNSNCADNQSGNTYTLAKFQLDSFDLSASAILFCPSVNATGTFSVTPKFTPTSGTAEYNGLALEVSGLATSSTLDQVGGNSTTSGEVTSASVTASGANASANDIVVACIGTNNSLTFNTPSGYTVAGANAANAALSSIFVYKIVSAIETSSAAWTWGGATIPYASTLGTFKGGSFVAPPAFAHSVSVSPGIAAPY